MRPLRSIWRLCLGAALALSLAANVAAFASAGFVSVVSAAVGALGATTVQARSAVARRAVLKRIAARTARGAARSLSGGAAQAMPLIGTGAVAAFTAWEIADACATLADLDALEPNSAPPVAVRLCTLGAGAATAEMEHAP